MKINLLLPAATKLGQGNIFTGVCLSTEGEGCLPQCMLGYTPGPGRPPREQTPRTRQTPPGPGRHPPQSRHHPPLRYQADTPLPWDQADTPPGTGRHPPEQRPPGSRHHPPTPGKQTSAHSQRAAGTHPTGMHSSCEQVLIFSQCFNLSCPSGQLN